jgi:hypothetical protein
MSSVAVGVADEERGMLDSLVDDKKVSTTRRFRIFSLKSDPLERFLRFH